MKWLALVFVLSCGPPPEERPEYFANVTNYAIRPSQKTPRGIAVDPSGMCVDLAAIDRKFLEVETCLRSLHPNLLISNETWRAGNCVYQDMYFWRPVVKISPDSHVGCLEEQVFPCSVDPVHCFEKGLTPTEACPCECRGAIQGGDVVTTPDLYLLKADIIRLDTSCNTPWVPGLEECLVEL